MNAFFSFNLFKVYIPECKKTVKNTESSNCTL